MEDKPTAKPEPQKLTLKQHFHSAYSISQFYDSDKKVEVFCLETGSTTKRNKKAAEFRTLPAERVWSQGAEHGFMNTIEREYHEEIKQVKRYKERNHLAITKYFLLWKLRYQAFLNPADDQVLTGITGSGLTEEEEYRCELNHMGFIQEGGVLQGRQYVTASLQHDFLCLLNGCKNTEWGLIKSTEGEFLVPDTYDDLPFMAISPTMMFEANCKDKNISYRELKKINEKSKQRAKHFYFARNISECPVISRVPLNGSGHIFL